jgi:hypothetical protein
MRSADWVTLLELIPAELHDNLGIIFTNGMELAVQTILRLEEAYVVVRGRPAGTTDAGRVFFVPYNQITYMGFQRPMQESDIRAIYGEPSAADEAPEDVPSAEPTDAPAQPATAANNGAPSPAPPVGPESVRPAARPSVLGKHGILERLRARAQASSTPKPPAGT